MRWRVPKSRLVLCLSLFLATIASLILSRRYISLYADRDSATNPKIERSIGDSEFWRDPQRLLAEANHFSWVWNGPKAEPLYARAEELFKKSGDKRDEIYAHVGELRARSETMSYTDVSEMIGREL